MPRLGGAPRGTQAVSQRASRSVRLQGPRFPSIHQQEASPQASRKGGSQIGAPRGAGCSEARDLICPACASHLHSAEHSAGLVPAPRRPRCSLCCPEPSAGLQGPLPQWPVLSLSSRPPGLCQGPRVAPLCPPFLPKELGNRTVQRLPGSSRGGACLAELSLAQSPAPAPRAPPGVTRELRWGTTVFALGARLVVLRASPWLCTQEVLVMVLGFHQGSRGSDPGQSRARRTPSPPCYCAGPNNDKYSSNNNSHG